MKLKIASMLLGENVRVILDKIRAHQDEASDYLSRLKRLLQNKQNIDQQLSDLDKHKKNLERQIVTLRSEIEEKRPLQKVAEQIIKIEEDTRSKEKEASASSSGNRELQQSVAHLQKDTVDLKSRKSLLEVEKRKYEENIGKDDTIPDELLSVNSEIVNLQNWLRIHSVELTQVENDITERIHALEEEDEPIEVPQDNIIEEDEETEKECEDETAIVVPTDKKEPNKVQRNDTIEPPIRKERDHKIKEIFDLETGETIFAKDFFKKPIAELEEWRAIFQRYISKNNRRFVCPKCLEMIRISGRGDERGVPAIFTHKNDSVSCKKTTTRQSVEDINRKKYGLFGQSQRHKDLKQELYDRLRDRNSLSLGISNVEMEKRVYSTLPFFSWRQPDVQIDYQGHKIVFEIQLSTTFLSVITERDTFYRLNDYYIIWIFNFDDNMKYVDLNNLAMKDIYFANKRNAFIFDDEARKWSRESGQLILKCNWVEPNSTWHYANTEKCFGGEPVTLNMLKFDHNTHKLYYYDAETPYYEQNPDIAERLIAEQKTKEEYIKELEKKAQEKEIRKQAAIEQMMRDGGHVIPFEEKKKIGFKYGVTTIIDPHFTYYEERGDGTFIVKYGPHQGLINQYGEMVIPCKSTDISYFGSHLIIYKIKENKEDLWRIPYFEDYELVFKKTDFWTLENINSCVLAIRLCSSEGDVKETIYCWNDSILLDRGYNSWHIYDKYGNSLSEREYDTIEFTDESKAKVTIDDNEGYINSRGEEIPVIEEFPDGYKSANFMGKYCLISPSGNFLSDYSYDALYYFNDGVYVFGDFKKKEYSKNWYGISRNHIEVIKQYYLGDRNLHPVTPLFSKIDKPINGIAYAYSGSGKGYDYESGKMDYLGMVYQLSDQGIIIPDEIVDLSNGNKIAKFGVEWNLHGKQEGKYKYATLLNMDNEAISDSYSEMEDIGNGYIIAKKKYNQIGVIQYDGKIQIPFEYEQIKQIEACGIKLLSVKKENKYGRIDFNKRIIVPIKFDNISWYNNKPYIIVERHHIVTKEKHYCRRTSYQSYIKKFYGLYHISGKKILDAIYSSIKVDDKMIVYFVLNGRKGYLDVKGNIVFEQTIDIPLGQTIDVSIKSINIGRKFFLAESADGKQTFIHWSWLNYGSNLNAYKVGDKLKLLNTGYDDKKKRIIWKEVSDR